MNMKCLSFNNDLRTKKDDEMIEKRCKKFSCQHRVPNSVSCLGYPSAAVLLWDHLSFMAILTCTSFVSMQKYADKKALGVVDKCIKCVVVCNR